MVRRRKPLTYYRDKRGRIRPVFAPKGRGRPTIIITNKKEAKSIRRQPFTRTNVEALEDRSGFYTLHDDRGNLLYAGAANSIRDRLVDSFYSRGDYRTVDEKGKLRASIAKFDVTYCPIEVARLNERRIKQLAPFNVR